MDGGPVPLGYRVEDRRLLIVPDEAESVRDIFGSYLRLRNVRELREDLDGRGIVSKSRVNRHGQQTGNSAFSRGALYALLSNPIYIGEIRHQKERHAGMHEAIVEQDLWNRVQALLKNQAVRLGIPNRKTEASWLAGRPFDEAGNPMTPHHAVKRGRRYRYYVSKSHSLVKSKLGIRASCTAADFEGSDAPLSSGRDGILDSVRDELGWRLPASEIESLVLRAIPLILEDHAPIAETAERSGIDLKRLPRMLQELQSRIDFRSLLKRAAVSNSGLELELRIPLVDAAEDGALAVSKLLPMAIKRRGIEMRMLLGDLDRPAAAVDQNIGNGLGASAALVRIDRIRRILLSESYRKVGRGNIALGELPPSAGVFVTPDRERRVVG